MRKEVKQVIRYPGSKARIASWIVSRFPKHETYLEPFCGSAVVLLAKPRAAVEIINDQDGRIVNLFRVIRDQPDALARAVHFTLWARDEYELSLEDEGDAVERARRFLVRCWQSFNASTADDGGWLKQSRESATTEARRWRTVPERIKAVTDRLAGVQIENRPALEVLAWACRDDVLIYADPPYRGECSRYEHGMPSDAEHQELITALRGHPGPVLLSAYPDPLYDQLLTGWGKETHENRVLNCSSRKELLWKNPMALKAHAQGALSI